MLKPSQPWQPCFVDPWRGVAHFDGLTIEADPITSSRQDLVLPCIEDEQVFFCRMLRALLPNQDDREGRLAFDLGSGSGVLSLYAASIGMRVTGIDVCDRALLFAKYNQRKNEAVIPDNLERVQFDHSDWNDSTPLQALKGQADYVLINAPFSPCLNGHDLTRCVAGGRLGQDAFLATLPIAYSLLKGQGRVYAIQLLLTDEQGKPKDDLFRVTGTENDRWSSVRVFMALKPVSVKEFLDGQYRSVTNHFCGAPSEAGGESFFSLAFIELTKGGDDRANEFTLVPPESNPLTPLPNWTWAERIHIHRLVSENYARNQDLSRKSESDSNGANVDNKAHVWIPSIALFLQRTTPYSALQHESGVSSLDGVSKLLTPTQIQIDQWIRQNDLLRSQSDPGGFDCLMVEAVPWHFATSRLRLRTETALWASSESAASEAPVSRALDRVLMEIGRFVSEERSIFLHPDHLRETNSHAWQQAVCYLRSEDKGDTEEPLQAPGCKNQPPAYHQGNVTVSSHLHELKQFGTRYVNPSRMSFQSCLRQALRAYTGIMRSQGLLSKETSHCYFLSLPVPLLNPKSGHAESGLVYVYAWASQSWSTSYECKVADIARLSSFLYEELYSESTRFQLDLNLRQTMLVSAAHEMKKLIYKIDKGITEPFAHLVQDYLLLNLEQELGDSFNEISNLLASGSSNALRELSNLAYVFEKLKSADPQLQIDVIDSWKLEASGAITVSETKLPRIVHSARDGANKPLHFAAGFLAGLRNAISHSNKGSNTDSKIEVTIDAGCIRITNSYTNTNSDELDQGAMKVKREDALPGTESVLQYHERRLFDDPGYQPRSRIIKLSCEILDKDRFRHTWTTDLYLTSFDTKAAT